MRPRGQDKVFTSACRHSLPSAARTTSLKLAKPCVIYAALLGAVDPNHSKCVAAHPGQLKFTCGTYQRWDARGSTYLVLAPGKVHLPKARLISGRLAEEPMLLANLLTFMPQRPLAEPPAQAHKRVSATHANHMPPTDLTKAKSSHSTSARRLGVCNAPKAPTPTKFRKTCRVSSLKRYQAICRRQLLPQTVGGLQSRHLAGGPLRVSSRSLQTPVQLRCVSAMQQRAQPQETKSKSRLGHFVQSYVASPKTALARSLTPRFGMTGIAGCKRPQQPQNSLRPPPKQLHSSQARFSNGGVPKAAHNLVQIFATN